MHGSLKYGVATGIWAFLVLIALLMPSPRGWGQLGEWLGPQYARVEHIVQPVAHFFFLAVMGYLLMRSLAWKAVWHRISITLMASLVIAVGFEALQSLLPQRFCRASDLGDLAYSAVGSGVGCLFAVIFERNSEKTKRIGCRGD